MATVRVSAPDTATEGEVIELKAMIQHEMESGFRRGQMGEQIPRDILKQFECVYNDEVVFSAEFFPAIAANPFLSFHIRAGRSGTLLFRWTDQQGETFSEQVSLEVQ